MIHRTVSALFLCAAAYRRPNFPCGRSGNPAAGESARPDFKPSEMNDALKSLTIAEKGGGEISDLRYDSSIPLDEKLTAYRLPMRWQFGKTDMCRGTMAEFRRKSYFTGRTFPGASS